MKGKLLALTLLLACLSIGSTQPPGAGPKVANQAARAHAYANYVKWLERLPEAVGYHWFEWCDEPLQGRFDGEHLNYGLVNVHDQPYRQFAKAVTRANRAAVQVHHAIKSGDLPTREPATAHTATTP